eukprot:g946.t1
MWLAILLSVTSGFSYGYHSAVIGPSLASKNEVPTFPVQKLWGCPEDAVCSSMTTAIAAGSFVLGGALTNITGALISQVLGNKRSRVIVLGAILNLFGVALTLLTFNLVTFSSARFVGGCGIGLLSFAVPAFVSELSPAHRRGFIVGTFPLAIVVAIFCTYVTGILGDTFFGHATDLDMEKQWKFIYGVLLIPGTFLVLLSLLAMFEANKMDEHGTPLLEGSEVGNEVDSFDLEEANARKPSSSTSPFSHLTSTTIIIAIGLACCQQLTGINAIINFLPEIFKASGAKNPLVSACVPALCNCLGTFFSSYIVDRIGRRPLLIGSLSVMTFSLCGVGVAFCITGNRNTEWLNMVTLLFMMLYQLAFAFGPGPLYYLLINEAFPEEHVRRQAVPLSNFFLWTSTLTTMILFPFLYEIGEDFTFFTCTAVSFGCLMFALIYVKETKGISLN